ncbi:hypothetical protein AtubIFM61612_003926 [Aspergillus tubingensis]|nr:hypothetical protein AtubIFM57143_004990 [Aspergillus tubingensis]GLB23333.1 hypothetical protein AtubIFM61612_003926 [Aspergillus tubingensis]
MENYPDHWKATLLGEEFWKDAEAYNQPIHDRIEADQDKPLHERFPFNQEHERNPHAPAASSANPDKRRSRRFSMNDAAFTGTPLATARVAELSRRPRSQSRTRSQSQVRGSSVASSRSSSLIRSALYRMANLMREESEDETEVGSVQLLSADEATPEKPLLEFRGGETWERLTDDRHSLGLDVFWPQELDNKENISDIDNKTDSKTEPALIMLDLEQMSPLCLFRNLRSLKIIGMMQSYQKYIWQAAWLNIDLEELELGMALHPRIRKNKTGDWPFIKGGWKLNKAHYAEPVYFGDGTGALDHNLGQAEYLDKMVIEKAKVRAMSVGRTRQKLSIRTLTLFGFIVDADPFLHWFDTKRLQRIHFKDYCVDAGFWLSKPMKKVEVDFPRQMQEKVSTARRVDLSSELKVIELKGGKKISEKKYTGPESLSEFTLSFLVLVCGGFVDGLQNSDLIDGLVLTRDFDEG